MKKLRKLRNKIDKIDNEISSLLLKRKKVIKRIGEYKKKEGIPIIDKNREKELILKLKNKTNNKKEQNYLVEIFASIIRNSRKVQR